MRQWCGSSSDDSKNREHRKYKGFVCVCVCVCVCSCVYMCVVRQWHTAAPPPLRGAFIYVCMISAVVASTATLLLFHYHSASPLLVWNNTLKLTPQLKFYRPVFSPNTHEHRAVFLLAICSLLNVLSTVHVTSRENLSQNVNNAELHLMS